MDTNETISPEDLLGNLSGGRVLDVATGSGNFIHSLVEDLKDYTEIIGVDNSRNAAAAFSESFRKQKNIHFQLMDVHHLDFPDSSFDLVCISNSLHHLDPVTVLNEMKRVLRPGGTLLVSEMYCDDQAETQMTHVLLHHWWAAVDTVNGIVHRETYTRQALMDMVSALGLQDVHAFDLSDLSEDPKSRDFLEQLDPVFESYIQRAEGRPELQARGEELKIRAREVGFHSATTLMVMGRKPG
ncbi:MAG TPA: methyltransferase domain-containing protein [Anaerolineales bacterium]|nr:methyltransferase domain-containing protein [Anaerolineales bacterium]HNN12988.1 methyltransferase domain-containing protein [Anaerolineales bacterium]HNO30355.1 methyltransferase domain-containing protein [Anaerolineales bacterium]